MAGHVRVRTSQRIFAGAHLVNASVCEYVEFVSEQQAIFGLVYIVFMAWWMVLHWRG